MSEMNENSTNQDNMPADAPKTRKKLGLLPRLIIGIAAGILIGSIGQIFGVAKADGFVWFIRLITTFTTIFSTFLNFVIPLLIVSFVSVGLAELGKKANKLFGITLGLAYASTVLAGFLSFFIGKALLPSLIAHISGGAIKGTEFKVLFSLKFDPVFSVMTALILAFTLGLAAANTNTPHMLAVLEDFKTIIEKVLSGVIIPLIPYYIAGTFAKIAASGELAPTIIMFAKLYVLILIMQWAYILLQFTITSLCTGENHWKDLKNIMPAYLTAVGTQSSAATIPVNLDSARKNHISDDVRNFVIPLCATIHLAGDTICLTLGSMGILIATGTTPTLATYAPFIFMLGITMVAAPGVPGGGVMAALGIIKSMLGFNGGMSELIIALHLSQDSFGTACNITGDQAIAAIVNHIDQRNTDKQKAA